MRKVLILAAACISALMLVGCGGGKEQSVTLTTEQSGATINMKLDAKGDIVQTMIQTTTMPTSTYTDEQIEVVEDYCVQLEETLGDIEGVEYSHSISDSEMLEELKVDMTNTDTLKQLSDLDILPLEGASGAKISLKKTQEGLTESGWTVVE